MSPEQIVKRYMAGQCHSLAFVLAEILRKPVGVLYAKREGERPIPDPLHVYVLLGEESILDVKGQRSSQEMALDFNGLLELLKRSEQDELNHHSDVLSSPDELYEDLGFDPSWIRKAELVLANGLWDRLEFEGKPALDPKTIPGMNRHKDFEEARSYGL